MKFRNFSKQAITAALLLMAAKSQEIPVKPPLLGSNVPMPSVVWAEEFWSHQDSFAPGSVVILRGTDLSAAAVSAPNGNWPTSLAGTKVLISSFPVGGSFLPIQSVSPTEVRVQLPYSIAPGLLYLKVQRIGPASLGLRINVSPTAPSVATDMNSRAFVTNADGTLNSDTMPAKGGTIVTVRAGSLGKIGGTLAAGVPADTAFPATLPVTVQLGSQPAIPATSADLEVGSVGVYLVKFVVPQTPYGKYELSLNADGASSNAGYMTVLPTKDPGSTIEPCAVMPTSPTRDGTPGEVILPPGATNLGIKTEITTGPLAQAFPNEETSTDLWLAHQPCDLNLGGQIPVTVRPPLIPDIPDPDAVAKHLALLGQKIADTTKEVDPQLPRIVAPNFVYNPQADPCFHPGSSIPFCNEVAKSPFGGKDIIYVHGLSFEETTKTALNQSLPKWPDDLAAFVEGGFYRNYAKDDYWDACNDGTRTIGAPTTAGCSVSSGHPKSHIRKFLAARNARNRFIMVGYSSAQRLEYGINALLTQIATAMTVGGPEVKCLNGANPVPCASPPDPRKDIAFCVRGCVVVSHSTGGLITDVSMAVIQDPSFIARFGDVRFIPQHIKVHVAAAGAGGGSQWATTVLALTKSLGNVPYKNEICTLALSVLDPNKVNNQLVCQLDDRLMDTILTDLNPYRTATKWRPWIERTPVPVLTVAGANHKLLWPLKYVVQRAYDDGVVSMDSSCGRPGFVTRWPTGFETSFVTTLDPRLFDLGLYAFGEGLNLNGAGESVRAERAFVEKSFEYLLSPLPWNLVPRAASACTPWKSPQGMVEKVRYLKFQAPNSPLTFYGNHFSFIQTSESHGAYTSKNIPLWRDDDLIGRDNPQYADERAIVDPKVYAPDTRPLFLNQPLVNPVMKSLEEFTRVGRYVGFTLFNRQFKIYIWRRSYIRLLGWETKAAMDYAYDYVM